MTVYSCGITELYSKENSIRMYPLITKSGLKEKLSYEDIFSRLDRTSRILIGI